MELLFRTDMGEGGLEATVVSTLLWVDTVCMSERTGKGRWGAVTYRIPAQPVEEGAQPKENITDLYLSHSH